MDTHQPGTQPDSMTATEFDRVAVGLGTHDVVLMRHEPQRWTLSFTTTGTSVVLHLSLSDVVLLQELVAQMFDLEPTDPQKAVLRPSEG